MPNEQILKLLLTIDLNEYIDACFVGFELNHTSKNTRCIHFFFLPNLDCFSPFAFCILMSRFQFNFKYLLAAYYVSSTSLNEVNYEKLLG